MKIKYVEIENILSIQKIRLDFGEAGLVLLDGWNYDDETANAAGKTAILNSIAYGIYGKFPRKISAADILRVGTKSGYVKVGIEVADTLYEVHRARPTNLQFWIDGLEKQITQAEFESHIRLSYTQYLIAQYSAQTEGLKLISLNDAGKKDFFLQLMSLDHFEDCKKEAEGQLNLLLSEKRKIESGIDVFKSRIEAYTESLVDVADLELRIEELDPTPLKEELATLADDEIPDTSKLDMLDEKLQTELQEIRIAQDRATHSVNQLAKLDRQIAKLSEPIKLANQVECPHCTESFSLGENGPVTIEHILEERVQRIDELKAERDQLLEVNHEDLEDRAVKIKGMIALSIKKRATIMASHRANIEKIADIKSAISRRQSQIAGFREAIDKNTQLQYKITEADNNILISQQRVGELDSEIELYETISGLFSVTGAPAYVLDSAVDVFNEKVGAYASLIWPNASYTLQSFKENKSGDVKAKFSEKLVINGKDRSIGALSGGEHRCLSLAVDFAIVDVLETMFGIQINPIMLDEPFNDLDASNRERVLDLLDKISVKRQIWVIDHASEAKSMFSNTVKVEKRSGISNLA